MRRLRVVAVDDHKLMLDAIRASLGTDELVELVGVADSGAEALELVERTRPDIVVLDIRMPSVDGFGVMRVLRERYPAVKVVVLSALDDEDVVRKSLEAGAVAFLSKSIEPSALGSVLLQAAEGTVPSTLGLPRSGDVAAGVRLTERELSILRAVGHGLSNKQIARDFSLAEQTVKFHLTKIFRKLGVRNRTEAARFVFEHGLGRPVSGSAAPTGDGKLPFEQRSADLSDDVNQPSV